MKSRATALALLAGLHGCLCSAKDTTSAEWPTYNNGYDGQRYSARR
jgi:hypothetical protein